MSIVLLNLLALLICQGSAIEFIDNGYENVVVSIHPDVPEENSEKIIEALKTFISDGSLKLFQSTKKLAYIKSVNILIPHTWSLPNLEVSDEYVYNDGQILVEKANVLYQNAPYTLQSSECGNLGKFIHLTPEYLLNLNDYNGDAEEIFGPHENIFVHEWAKLRYGVFEEYGYPGDLVYPLFTHEPSGDDAYEVEPNFNTNLPLKGEMRYKIERFNKKISHKFVVFRDFETGGKCSEDAQTNLPDSKCGFFPRVDENLYVKSSIMAAPFLEWVEDFSEYSDASSKPTRQNFLCNQRSTWDVIESRYKLRKVLITKQVHVFSFYHINSFLFKL